jgi:hypothetical protein
MVTNIRVRCCYRLSTAVIFFATLASGQSPDEAKPVHLSAGRATVFISFEKLEDERTGKFVILRIHNNSIFDLKVCSYHEQKIEQNETEIAPCYSLESSGYWEWAKSKPRWVNGPVPPPIPCAWCDLPSDFVMISGSTAVFKIPESQLQSGISVSVPFRYPWEVSQSEPSHRVLFRAKDVRK